MTDATGNTKLQHWPNLAVYGLKLFLVRSASDTIVLAGGHVEQNEEALQQLGFRQHSKTRHWYVSVSEGGRLSARALRREFPRMSFDDVDPALFVLTVQSRATNEITRPILAATPAEAEPDTDLGELAGDTAQDQPARRANDEDNDLDLAALAGVATEGIPDDAMLVDQGVGPGMAIEHDDYAARMLDIAPPDASYRNYRLTDPKTLLSDTWRPDDVVQANLAALAVLADLERNQSPPSEDEASTLIHYAGWGGLPGMFAERHELNNSYGERLKSAVDEDAYRAMRASTINAHYTDVRVVDALWAAVVKAGFGGGRVLEPGAGTGLFMARVPSAVADSTSFVAVEKDPTSARILRALYPEAKVFAMGYEEAPIPDNSVDLVIGNVPFGNYRVHDPKYNQYKALIHDYFILKSMDKLRPGGLMMLVTGTGTLDRGNSTVREAMHERGDLLAAFRLPNDSFQANANTSVTTDVLLLRKRVHGETALAPFDWQATTEIMGADGERAAINGVFATERGHILGYLHQSKDMYGSYRNTVSRRLGANPSKGTLEALLATIPATVPAGIHQPQRMEGLTSVRANAEVFEETAGGGDNQTAMFDGNLEGSFVKLLNGRAGAVVNGRAVALTGLSAAAEDRILTFLPLRDAVGALLQLQLDTDDDSKLSPLQATLDDAYEAFVRKHGRVAEGRRNVNRSLLQDDPLFDAVHALEVLDDDGRFAGKADIFRSRTVGHVRSIVCETAHDALIACINTSAKVDPDWIAKHAHRPWAQCVEELKGLIYRNPSSGDWEIAERYLSGNVRAKLRLAETAAAADPSLSENVSALQERLPTWLTRDEINASLGAHWIDIDFYKAFVAAVYSRPPNDTSISVAFIASSNSWEVSVPKHYRNENYDTAKRSAAELIEASLNGRVAKVTRTVTDDEGRKSTEVDEVATSLAIDRQMQLKALFARWVWSDEDRAARLEVAYNDLFNSHRSANYSAIPVQVSGMTTSRELRGHQNAGVARALLESNVLLAHPVGFGKTATFAATAMKLRQVFGGKSLVVTPKNVISQFAGETKRWFPTSRVLTVSSEDLTPKGRARFWRRVQVTNPDVIITTPEAFKRLRLPREAEQRFLMDEISEIETGINAINAQDTSRLGTREVKRMETRRAGLTTKLQGLINIEEKDTNRITMADLGITTLMVDEAHRFKALQVLSSEQILGIPASASQRAFDMLSKVRYIQAQPGGKVVFGTGSMITNTLAEAYNMQRYLQPELMNEMGLLHFDAWRSQFAETVQSLEPDPAGKGYRIVVRLAEIQNVPELVRMMAQCVDSVADNNTYFDRPTPHFSTVSVLPTPLQERLRESLAERVALLRERSGPPQKGDDNILAVLGEARRGALDVRTLFPNLPDEVGGHKIGTVAAKVAEIYKRTADVRGAQAVFLDLGTPKAKAESGWNAYDALAAHMTRRGIPRDEIAYIHDAKTDDAKLAIYRRVRQGSIRVLIGSTEKMGEGANIQDRLAALHHLNAPFHPGAVVQRNGRIIRNGNTLKDVEIYTYVTKGMLEDWNWHLVTLKAGFINAIMEGMAAGTDGAGLERKMVEDGDSMSYDAIEAEASDNPLVKRKAVVDSDVRRLSLQRTGWVDQASSRRRRMYDLQNRVESSAQMVSRLERLQAAIEAAEPPAAPAKEYPQAELMPTTSEIKVVDGTKEAEAATPAEQSAFAMTVGDRPFTERRLAGLAVLVELSNAENRYRPERPIGRLSGLDVIAITPFGTPPYFEIGLFDERTRSGTAIVPSADPVGMVRRLENAIKSVAVSVVQERARITAMQAEIDGIKAVASQVWPHQEALDALVLEQSSINHTLASENDSASNEGIDGFHRALAEFGVVAQRDRLNPLDDFDVSSAIAELGASDAMPDGEDDEDQPALDDEDEAPRLAASAGRSLRMG